MPSTSNAIILKASAGSGKTFTLAKVFIKHLILSPNDYHQVLALTFTNDAKNEMKSRILKELSALATEEKSVLLEVIEADFKKDNIPFDQAQIFHRSHLALTNLLNDYSRFNVVTLDHFFTQLIRHLARELKLRLGYELDLDVGKAMDEAVYKLYQTDDKRVKKWLRAFINTKIEEDKGWNIEFNIKNLGNKLFQDSFIDIKDKLKANIDDLEGFVTDLQKQVSFYQSEMKNTSTMALELITSHQLEESDFRANLIPVFKKLKAGTQDLTKPFSATFINAEWTTKKSEKKEEVEACAQAGLQELREHIIGLVDSDLYVEFLESRNLISNIYSYGVLSALSENLWEYKSANNLLLLSDTATILDGVVSLSDAPFIYEKIGAKFTHIMIDEFQDTSTHQWKNILPLLQYALFDEGSLLLVGDVKQSIYRWRGGDVNLLMHQAATDLSDHSPIESALDTNYRSSKNIIAFNNEFFKTAGNSLAHLLEGFANKTEDLTLAYEDVVQKPQKQIEGYVKIKFFGDNEGQSWKEQAFEATKDSISNALQDGFAPEDILILVRRNKEASEVATYLLGQGIHTITDEALQLEKSPLVQFLINALHLVLRPSSKLALTKLSYFLNIIHKQSASQSLENILENSPLSRVTTNLNAYEAIEKLIEDYRLNEQFDPFLQGFQDVCLSLSQKGYVSISSFLDRWDELHQDAKTKPSIVLGKPKGAVQVKSIHKSKGLESPVVIMPQISGGIYRPQHVFWPGNLPKRYEKWGSLPVNFTSTLELTDFKDNYEQESFEIALEELNTLYVGFTRAIERLYVFVQDKKLKKSFQHIIKETLGSELFSLSSHFDGNVFELGKPDPAHRIEDGSVMDRPLTNYPTSDPALKLAPTAEKDFWKQLNTDKANNIRSGIQLHSIMAQLKTFELPALNNSLGSILQLMVLKGAFTEGEASVYKQKVKKLFSELTDLHQWFETGWDVINEHKILAMGNAYIPDRVVIKGNTAVILDFKRGAKSDGHKNQIKNYANLLTQMGYQVKGMYLVYIELVELVEVV
ncbi:MAG: UvrD-helicase domain-containing protein [Cyclobacteriaceae bacterium]|nr:UvrD-helicase domain-containing protein [Cyclobacteriaceae bacterium]